MPLLPSWVEYVPDSGQARRAVEQATVNARLVAANLATATARECAEGLVDAAAETFRIFAIASDCAPVWRPFLPAFDRARHDLEICAAMPTSLLERGRREPSRRGIAGVIAFANIPLSIGGSIDGYYDLKTRDGLAREMEWLELAARLVPSSHAGAADVDRLLGFAALAVGRPDLALGFSSDDALVRLVAAVESSPREEWHAFTEFVDAFPGTAHGYAELGFVARAFSAHVEGRGAGGIGGAASWLHRTIHEGPSPPKFLHPPQPELTPRPSPWHVYVRPSRPDTPHVFVRRMPANFMVGVELPTPVEALRATDAHAPVERARVRYDAGSENNPGNPFGRCALVIELDGRAELDHYARGGGHSTWTGQVESDTLDRLWTALEQAGFPDVPRHPIPAGSTMRSLAIGRATCCVTWDASDDLPGYNAAFRLLDGVVRQLMRSSDLGCKW